MPRSRPATAAATRRCPGSSPTAATSCSSRRADFLWVRILDVAGAAVGRARYLAPGRVVLEVVDAPGYAAGRFALDGGPDGASCAPTDRGAGLTLAVDALGAASLGGAVAAVLADAGRVDVHDDAALATADAMFRGAVDALVLHLVLSDCASFAGSALTRYAVGTSDQVAGAAAGDSMRSWASGWSS